MITGTDGRRVNSSDALTAIVRDFPPGSVMQVTWIAASGATRTVVVRLGPAPAI